MTTEEAQFLLEDTKARVMEFLADAKKPYYVLYRDNSGTSMGTRTDWGETESPEHLWERVESAVINWMKHGRRSFMVQVSKGGKHDGTGKATFPLDFNDQKASMAVAGLSGIFGTQAVAQVQGGGVPIGYVSIGELKNLEERIVERFQHKDEVRELTDTIAALQEQRKDPIEKFFDRIEGLLDRLPEPVQNTLAMGLVAKMTGGAAPGFAAVGNAGPAIVRHHEEGEVPDMGEFDEQEDFAILAVRLLGRNGVEYPGETMHKMAKFYLNNRAMVDGIIASQQGQQQQPTDA